MPPFPASWRPFLDEVEAMARAMAARQHLDDPPWLRERRNDVSELRQRLIDGFEGLITYFEGDGPTKRNGDERRWRDGKSLSGTVTGKDAGSWYDHYHEIGGGPFQLIMERVGCDFRGAVDWARQYLGQHPGPAPTWQRPNRTKTKTKEQERLEAIAEARRLAAASVPIEGTRAEVYLTQWRKIPRPESGWPDSIRYHPGSRALLVVVTGAAGQICAVQRIYLDSDGRKRSDLEVVKRSRGPVGEGVVRLPGVPGPLLIAEGPETGLSLWAATRLEVWITLGGMSRLDLPVGRQVIICRDDDKPKAEPITKGLAKTMEDWRNVGLDVCVATPWQERRHDGSDFNDLIQAGGIAAIRARIAAAVEEADAAAAEAEALAQAEEPRVPLPIARDRVHAAVVRFFAAVEAVEARDKARAAAERQAKREREKAEAEAKAKGEEPPKIEKPKSEPEPPLPVHAVWVGLGIGKTHAALGEAVAWLARARQRRSKRTVAIAVPRHKLADELVKRIEATAAAHGLQVRVWRGREADDPTEPGEQMCRDLDAVRAVQKGYGDPATQVCGVEGQEQRCAMHEICAYLRQAKQTSDVWLVPHETIFGTKPAALGKLAALIVDEAVWSKGLEGHEGKPVELTLDALNEQVDLDIWPKTERLQFLQGQLRNILDQHADGPLSREALLAGGYTHEMAIEARKLTYERKREPAVVPGMTKKARDAALAEVAGHNRNVMRLAQVFGAVRDLLAENGPVGSGWVQLVTTKGETGPQRVFRLRRRRQLGKGWQVPVLLMDATLDPELVRPCWPQVELVERVEAEMPHARIRQFVGHEWAMSRLIPDPAKPEGENKRRWTNSRELRAALFARARRVPGQVLIIGYKDMIAEWRQHPVPANVELAHHGAVAGEDRWRDVRLLIVIGRLEPGPADIERTVEALTGAAVTQSVQDYLRSTVSLPGSHGTAAMAARNTHPDPMAERVRWQVCEAALMQAIGRARAVNRTADNRVEIMILCSRLLPLPVDEVIPAEELQPSMADLMMAEGAIELTNHTDIATHYPTLWPSRDAVKKAMQREGQMGTSPYRESPTRRCPHLVGATYRLNQERKGKARLWFDPAIVPAQELRARLEERLGALALLEIDPVPVVEAKPVEAVVPPEVDPIAALAEDLTLPEPEAPAVDEVPRAEPAPGLIEAKPAKPPAGPTIVEQQLAEGGVVFEEPGVVARVYKQIWPTRASVIEALGTKARIKLPRADPVLRVARCYWGRRWRDVVFDPAKVLPEQLEAWLGERLKTKVETLILPPRRARARPVERVPA